MLMMIIAVCIWIKLPVIYNISKQVSAASKQDAKKSRIAARIDSIIETVGRVAREAQKVLPELIICCSVKTVMVLNGHATKPFRENTVFSAYLNLVSTSTSHGDDKKT